MQKRKLCPRRAYYAIFALLLAICASETHAQVIINEIDCDTPGTDNLEFIELFDGGTGNVSLDGLALVLFNGSNGESYRAIDLNGQSTNAGGYFVAGNAAVQNVDLTIPNSAMQNGPDAVALFSAPASDFPNGTALTTENLVDAIVYGTGDPDNEALLVLLNPGQPQADESGGGDKDNHSLQRIPNGSGGARNTETFTTSLPTPGSTNGGDSEPVEFNLEIIITPDGAGSLSLNPDKTVFADGELVTIEAVPSPGYQFATWSGDIGNSDAGSPTILLTMDQNRIVEAEFVEIQVPQRSLIIDITPAGSGEVMVVPEKASYDDGEQVTLTATAASGYEFVGWSGDIDDSDASSTTLAVVMDQDRSIQAMFAAIPAEPHTLTVSVTPEGGGQVVVDPDKTSYDDGEEVTLTATVAPGYGFTGWSGDIDGADAGSRTLAVVMNQDRNIKAMFAEIPAEQYGLAVSVSPEGSGQILIDPEKEAYDRGEHVTLTAVPASGYRFDIWDGDVASGDLSSSEIELTMDSDKQVVAGFKVTAAPVIEVVPLSLDFDRVKVGDEREISILVSNTGDDQLLITGAEFQGCRWNQWFIRGGNMPLEISAGENIEIVVVFKPKKPGNHSAVLRLTSNDPANPEIDVALSGTACGFYISFRKSPWRRKYRMRGHHDQKFEIRNEGDEKLQISGAWLKDQDGTEIAYPVADLPSVIEAGSSVELDVSFLPASTVNKLAGLRIMSSVPGHPDLNVELHPDVIENQASGIVINEIHYNPSADQGSDNQFEFIELFNTSDSTAYLEGVTFGAGIEHTFEETDSIAALGFLVLARDSTVYPGSLQWQSGSLVNQGEALVLLDSTGSIIDSVSYSASSPWPDAPNGDGASLELISADLDNSDAASWQASSEPGGTPGRPNSKPAAAAELVIHPGEIDFGNVAVGDSAGTVFYIVNRSEMQAMLLSSAVDGDTTAFALRPPDNGQSISPMDSLAISINFFPDAAGPLDATIQLIVSTDADTTLLLPVTGSGQLVDSVSVFAGVIVINEIHYNPAAEQGSDNAFEFIELHNTGPDSVNLAGFTFNEGIEHAFQNTLVLPPGDFLVMARDSSTYGGSVQWDAGSLLNGGETIAITDPFGAIVDLVSYSATAPWPAEANGDGSTLELIGPELDNMLPESWQASQAMGGTPGLKNSASTDTTSEHPTDVTEPGLVPKAFALSPNFPNPFNPTTQISFQVPERAEVELTVFNLKGELIKTLIKRDWKRPGVYEESWRATDDFGQRVASGVYIFRLTARGETGTTFRQSRKMTLLK